ncbi:MAG: hypothetical protein H6839_00130 [Planctomycetes bacterium]|nr:hypothetical protein [Planctomycetota bacterium]
MGNHTHEIEPDTGRFRSRLDGISLGCLLVSCLVLAAGGLAFWWLI